jgi:glyoxylase-like metal-dependent hydrolase (beta-lactamase superfamily II)
MTTVLKRLTAPVLDRAQRAAVGMMTSYFNHPTTQGSALTRLSDRVLTFNWYFDRAIIVETDDGLMITDPFNTTLTTQLSQQLHDDGIHAPCHTVVYTHFHLDHVRGAAALQPRHIVAHTKCPEYWKDFEPEATAEVLTPTDLVDGDTSLTIGGVEVELLDVGLSHTDTLLLVHIPSERILYSADTVGIGVFLPTGGISLYTPGYFRALDRMAKLDFDIFVGSHFGWGTKAEFLDAVQHQYDIRDWVRDALRRHTGTIPPFQDRRSLLAIYDDVHTKIKSKYQSLHGYDTQALYAIISSVTAEYVGY